jgi:NTE family protein
MRPDLICGTSVAAINGAALAADPTTRGVQRLLTMWRELGGVGVIDGSLVSGIGRLVSHRTALHGNAKL